MTHSHALPHLPPAPEILVRMPATPCEIRITTTVKMTPTSSQRISGTLMPLCTLVFEDKKKRKNEKNEKKFTGL